LHGGPRAKLPHRVKNPIESQTLREIRRRGGKYRFEICFDLLMAKLHDTDGKRYLRISHVLGQQLFREILRDKRIVLRITQQRRDPFKCVDKSREVRVIVPLAHLFLGDGNTMSRRQRRDDCRTNRPFEVQVQFSLG